MDAVYWDHSYNSILILNLLIVIGLFTSLRLFSGTISHVNATNELIRKDNPAFGVSLAGVTFAITLMLSGTIYGDPEVNMLNSAIAVGLYGIIGIILMALTRIIFDRLALPNISLRDEIVKGNMAAAIADTGNVIAAALIVRAIMIWVTHNSLDALGGLVIAYLVSQVILTAVTMIKLKMFPLMHKNYNVEEELAQGNVALGLSFAGRKIATAIAIAMASEIVVYEIYDIKSIIFGWVFVSIIVIILMNVLASIAKFIILFRVRVFDEILGQRNVAIGALEAVIYISMALLLAEL